MMGRISKRPTALGAGSGILSGGASAPEEPGRVGRNGLVVTLTTAWGLAFSRQQA